MRLETGGEAVDGSMRERSRLRPGLGKQWRRFERHTGVGVPVTDLMSRVRKTRWGPRCIHLSAQQLLGVCAVLDTVRCWGLALSGAADAQGAALGSLRWGSGAGDSSGEGTEQEQTSRRPGARRSACRKEMT